MEQFEFLEVLGRGSYGTAHLVRQKRTSGAATAAASSRPGPAGPLRVIKEIDMSDMSPTTRSQAWREAKVLRSLSHVNIIAHVATFMQNSRLHIVMEYADAGDMAHAISQKRVSKSRFSRQEVLGMFAQCCQGLEHTHARHILHRDLKSQNIFLTKAGVVKLGDFGIAKVLDHTTAKAASRVGTPYYVSPEVCDGQCYNFKADIWSLGVVLYELAALEPPFQANNLVTLFLRILQSDPPPLSGDYGADLQELVLRMMHKEPQTRPSCPELLQMPMVRMALAHMGPSRPPPPPLDHADVGGLPELLPSPMADTVRPELRHFGKELKKGIRRPKILEELPTDPADCIDGLLQSLERDLDAAESPSSLQRQQPAVGTLLGQQRLRNSCASLPGDTSGLILSQLGTLFRLSAPKPPRRQPLPRAPGAGEVARSETLGLDALFEEAQEVLRTPSSLESEAARGSPTQARPMVQRTASKRLGLAGRSCATPQSHMKEALLSG